MKIIDIAQKMRCPRCSSNKWSVTAEIDEEQQYSKKRHCYELYWLYGYKCKNCGEKFIVKVRQRKSITHGDRCCYCGSKHIEKFPFEWEKKNLYKCRRCKNLFEIIQDGGACTADNDSLLKKQ